MVNTQTKETAALDKKSNTTKSKNPRNKGTIPFRTSNQKRELYDTLLERLSTDIGFKITSASFLKPVFDQAFIDECEKRGYEDLKTDFLKLEE
jgi:hypothetical protein